MDDAAFLLKPVYDYHHFSIECSSFTMLGHAGQSRVEGNDFLGNEQHAVRCQQGSQMIGQMIDMIGGQLKRNPDFLFTIENPYTSKMQHHPLLNRVMMPREHRGLGATKLVVDYCHFWDGGGGGGGEEDRPFHKRTTIWTNSPTLIREFGVDIGGAHYLCQRQTPCAFYCNHRAVCGRTAAAATPFPKRLAMRIAQAINRDASKKRFRPIKVPVRS